MKVPKSDEGSLLIALTEALQAAKVAHWGYISLPENWEENLKSAIDPDFKKRLYSNLDDGELESLIQRQLFRELYDNNLELPEEGSSKALTTYKMFKDPLKTARSILDTIKSLPKQYEVIVRALDVLAEKFGDKEVNLKIYERMYLTSGSRIKGAFLITSGNEQIDSIYMGFGSRDKSLRDIDERSLYFVYRTSGLVSDRTKPKPFNDFYDDLRAFYGAAISFDLFHSFTRHSKRSSAAVMANLIEGDVREFRHCEQADIDIADGASLYAKKTLTDLIDGGASIEDILAPIIKLFNSDEAQRLKTAAIWLLRAHRNPRGMDQILDSTIAIEVLLGDREASDRIGLSKLMANRCAYSLGKSASERKDLYDFFTQFYRVRSDIVHSGRIKLLEGEVDVVHKGIRLASRILRHETEIG